MLMDELFRGLDAMTRELMQERYLRLFEEQPRTNLFVTSELGEALFLADRLLVMSEKPTHVMRTIVVDLPRPRSFHMLTSSRVSSSCTPRRSRRLREGAAGILAP